MIEDKTKMKKLSSPLICCILYCFKLLIPSAHVFIPQRIRYERACCNYTDFLHYDRLLTITVGFWNSVMLLHEWSHHYRSFMVVIMNSWIITVYQFATWASTNLFSVYNNFPLLFRLPWTWLFMSNSTNVSRKAVTLPVQLVHVPSFF